MNTFVNALYIAPGRPGSNSVNSSLFCCNHIKGPIRAVTFYKLYGIMVLRWLGSCHRKRGFPKKDYVNFPNREFPNCVIRKLDRSTGGRDGARCDEKLSKYIMSI